VVIAVAPMQTAMGTTALLAKHEPQLGDGDSGMS